MNARACLLALAVLAAPAAAQTDLEGGELVASCIEDFPDAERGQEIMLRNICPEAVQLAYVSKDLPGTRITNARLEPQEAEGTGLTPDKAPQGFLVAICRDGAQPVSPEGLEWEGGAFRCKRR